MSTVDPSILSSIGVTQQQPKPAKQQQLGQADFLKLMTTQLKFQDPLKPMDNSAFLGQMAQFSTVSGIQSLQDSFTKLAASLQSSDALQASGIVGRNVMVPSASGYLPVGGTLQAAAELPASGNLVVDVTDSAGQVVRTLSLGPQSAGLASFGWDGLANSGERLPEGRYNLNARLERDGQTESLKTYAVGHVNSVSLGTDGLTLDLQGMSPAAFGQVRQIM